MKEFWRLLFLSVFLVVKCEEAKEECSENGDNTLTSSLATGEQEVYRSETISLIEYRNNFMYQATDIDINVLVRKYSDHFKYVQKHKNMKSHKRPTYYLPSLTKSVKQNLTTPMAYIYVCMCTFTW